MDFTERLFQTHQQFVPIPSPQQVCSWLDGLLKLLFPELADRDYQQLDVFQQKFKENKVALQDILQVVEQDMSASAEAATIIFYKNLPSIYDILQKDANAILTGDPAALSKTEVIRTYPGFFAIAVYRLAHEFHKLNVPLVPRILTEHAHGRTGIDIHPAANIGERFCIDHGTGIVIGETVEIGTDVKIYQGVTLGALSVKRICQNETPSDHRRPRHYLCRRNYFGWQYPHRARQHHRRQCVDCEKRGAAFQNLLSARARVQRFNGLKFSVVKILEF